MFFVYLMAFGTISGAVVAAAQLVRYGVGGNCQESWALPEGHSDRMRDSRHRLECGIFKLCIKGRMCFFTVERDKHWGKKCPDKLLSHHNSRFVLMYLLCS